MEQEEFIQKIQQHGSTLEDVIRLSHSMIFGKSIFLRYKKSRELLAFI